MTADIKALFCVVRDLTVAVSRLAEKDAALLTAVARDVRSLQLQFSREIWNLQVYAEALASAKASGAAQPYEEAAEAPEGPANITADLWPHADEPDLHSAVADAPPCPSVPAADRPAPLGRPHSDKWRTLERKAVLIRDWPLGIAPEEISARMAELPGATMAGRGLTNWASELGLRRPMRAASTPAVPLNLASRDGHFSQERQSLLDDAKAAALAPMSIVDAMLWGARNKIWPLQDERPMQIVARVNKLRLTIGLPAFTIVPTRSRGDALPETKTGARYEGEPA